MQTRSALVGTGGHFPPKKLTQSISQKHQLACHFVDERALLKARLRVAAQTPRPLAYLILVGALVEQVGQLVKEFGDVLDKLAESEQGREVCAPVGVDFVNPRARQVVETLAEE